eukprot:664744-Pleurochrysis_carterae.AAC.1
MSEFMHAGAHRGAAQRSSAQRSAASGRVCSRHLVGTLVQLAGVCCAFCRAFTSKTKCKTVKPEWHAKHIESFGNNSVVNCEDT